MHFIVVGAGLTGAVMAKQLASAGGVVTVIDQRSHVGGNVYTGRFTHDGPTVHQYGPHIFHTNDKAIWDYMGGAPVWEEYRHTVWAVHDNQTFSLPVNLHTICQ